VDAKLFGREQTAVLRRSGEAAQSTDRQCQERLDV
jgi:hypothetical protein